MALLVKNSPAKTDDVRDAGLISRSGRSPGGGHDNPFQYTGLENPMDRGAWRAAVYRVAKSWIQPKWLSTHKHSMVKMHARAHTHTHTHIMFSDYYRIVKRWELPVFLREKQISLFTAAAAAKSLRSCPTLCDPIDGSPPGSHMPRILQARTLEWVAISFSNAWKRKVKVKSLSQVRLLATPWTAAYQAPLSMGFSRLPLCKTPHH